MKHFFISLFSLIIVISACKNDAKPEVQEITTAAIASLESKYNTSQTIEDANELLTKYAEYAVANPEDKQNNSRYLRRSAQIYNSTKEYTKAAGATVLALKQFYGTRDTEANIASLVDYYQKLDNTDAAFTTMNGYLMVYPDGVKKEAYETALAEDKKPLPKRLEELAVEIVKTSPSGEPQINDDAINKFIGVAEIYTLTNHKSDTLASEYLFKAGKLAMTYGDVNKANELYEWIYGTLKTKEAPSALFTHAFTLDSQLGEKDKARVLYEKFLAEYPEHHFADDSEFQLKNLGKNDAQIIEEFNNQVKSKE